MAQEDRRNGITSVSQSSSMFDLEPNPFEQSFASTKKSHPASAAVPSSQEQRIGGGSVLGQAGERNSRVTISEITSSSKETDASGQRQSSVFSYGAQKPHLQSPPLLTPGGSRRLPPILLSPNFIQQAPNGSSVVPNYSSMSPKNEHPNSNVELQRPPLNLSLSKTVFTPNESGLRTGLTPAILGPTHPVGGTHHSSPSLPYFSGPRNDVGPLENMKNSAGFGINMALNNDLGSQSHTYTSGIGSLAGYSPPKGYQQSTNMLSRNGVLPAAGAIADSNGTRWSAQPQGYVGQPLNTSTKDRQVRAINSNSPPRTAIRRKRKSSTNSRSSKSSKSSQRTTPISQDSKNLVKKDTNDPADRDSDDDQERKRREFLERNRVAASKFRKRKKEYIKRVEMDLKFYEAEYEDMSHAMDKLCGIVDDSSPPNASSSLIYMLETAISKNDAPSSLSILTHIKQILYETRYFQRNGRNPRREMEFSQDSEDDDRQRTDKELSTSRHGSIAGVQSLMNPSRTPGTSVSGPVAASYITGGAPPSTSTGSSKSVLTDTSVPSIMKEEDTAAEVYSAPLTEDKKPSDRPIVPSAIGTISSLPTVINGRPVIPLNDIDPHSTAESGSISGIRQSSLVSLTSDVVNSEPISFKYPNSD